jgi:hypothetical protein
MLSFRGSWSSLIQIGILPESEQKIPSMSGILNIWFAAYLPWIRLH